MFTLDQVVPWGRSFEEYRRMFALSDAELHLRILGCADGPASFNAESTRRGTAVISIDPLYLFLYTEHLSEAFHRSAILESCRVAREVRIFPLLALDGCTSRYIARGWCTISATLGKSRWKRCHTNFSEVGTRCASVLSNGTNRSAAPALAQSWRHVARARKPPAWSPETAPAPR
jgi:hypothetical protein